jgi:hypothetical protein
MHLVPIISAENQSEIHRLSGLFYSAILNKVLRDLNF